MSDFPATVVGPLLSVLRTLPVWVLAGFALAGYAVLFAPAFGGVDPTDFRTQWGVWVWIEALTFSILTIARGMDAGVNAYRAHRQAADSSRALRLVPRQLQSWWHLAKQQDDSFVSQISLKVEAANVTDRPVRIVRVRLIWPWAKDRVLHSLVTLPSEDNPYHSDRHAVPPHNSLTASIHIMVRGVLAAQGKPLRVTLGVTDQLGVEYRIKRIVIPTHDPVPSKQPWKAWLASHLTRLPGFRRVRETEKGDAGVPPPEWQHEGRFQEVDLVLNEERRNYAANGRERGGLGSLNVTLQSEPNFGWTEVGKVPSLLCDKANAKRIESPNADRLIRLHSTLCDAEKNNLERYLLSHLHKRSRYAEVSYFIFFALHRMGQTIAALQAARLHLAGDKVYGYSNLLGTLSAIISHEHFQIPRDLYAQISETLAGDSEHDFRLAEKINSARLQHLDAELEAADSRTSPAPSALRQDG
jgi:hypothetical protein